MKPDHASRNDLRNRAKERLGREAVDGPDLSKLSAEEIGRLVHDLRAHHAKALRHERDKLSAILNSMVDGVYIADRNYVIRYINPALLCEFGPVEGRKCYEYFRHRKEVCPGCRWDDVLGGRTARWEWASLANGKAYDVIETPLMEPDGSTSKLTIMRDVTEQKQAKEEIQRLAKFPSENPSPVLRVRAEDGTILYANDSAASLLKVWECRVNEPVPVEWREFALEVFRSQRYATKEADCENRTYALTFAAIPGADYVNVYGIDVRERNRALEDTHEARRFAEAVVDTVRDPLVVLGEDMSVISANRAFYEFFHISPQEAVGRSIYSLGSGVWDIPDLRRLIEKALRRGEPFDSFEMERDFPAIGPKIVRLNARRVQKAEGKSDMVLLAIEDVTKLTKTQRELENYRQYLERKVEERTAQLRESTGVLENVFSTPHVLMAYTDAEFNFLRVNHAYARADGRDPTFFIGKNHFKLYPHAENERIFRGVVTTGKPYTVFAKPFEYPDNPERGVTYWDWNVHPVKDASGKVKGLVLCLVNVTERERTLEALKESETKHRTLVEQIPAITYISSAAPGANSAMYYISPQVEKLMGFSVADYKADPDIWRKQLHPEDRDRVIADLVDSLASDRPFRAEYRMLTKDGRVVWFRDEAVVVKDEAGEPAWLQGVMYDITEQKRIDRRTNVLNSLLKLFAQKAARKEYLNSVAEVVRDWSGCRCVGIRVTTAEGYIPYEAYVGFSREFWELENKLSLRDDRCVCIRMVSRSVEPQEAAFVTPGGSFRCNDTGEFVNGLSKNERAHYRVNCMRHGFRSLAVVPIRYRDEILGAIHLADERTEMVPQENIEFIEVMSPLIGEALHRFSVEEALRESELLHRTLFENAPVGIGLFTPDGQALACNHALLKISGYTEEGLKRTNLRKMCENAADRKRLLHHLRSGDAVRDFEVKLRRKDRTPFTANLSAARFAMGGRNVLLTMFMDISERKRMEEKILAHQNALRSLSAQLSKAEEEERRRFATAIHDLIGQTLTLSLLRLQALEEDVPAQLAKPLDAIREGIDQAIDETQKLIFDLSPPVLYQAGLKAALISLAHRLQEEHSLACRIEDDEKPMPMSDEMRAFLFRAVRELLINVIKHAEAESAVVALRRDGGRMEITVQDDGVGFDDSEIESPWEKLGGFGLFSIRERLESLGGSLVVESGAGRGTRVVLTVPLAADASDEER